MGDGQWLVHPIINAITRAVIKTPVTICDGSFSLSGQSISRILSSGLLRLCDHLSGRRVAAPLDATYPGLAFLSHKKARKEGEPPPTIRRWLRPCLVLLLAGVTWPSVLLQMPVVFYTTFSPSPPSPLARQGWLFVSVALIRQVSSSRRVPRPGCYPTPCSMECGLSSAPTTQDRDRPTDLRHHHHTRKVWHSQRRL